MEDLEGQEAIPTTESEISPAKVLTGAEAAAYVEGMRRRGEITEWEIPLRATIDSVTGNYLRTRVDYNSRLGHVFHGLPFNVGESSSNETTEPPAKEKYSAFTPGPWFWDGCHLDSADGGYVLFVALDSHASGTDVTVEGSDADKALISAAPDLYDACEKALGYVEEEGQHSDLSFWAVTDALAAALTKAGKK